MVDIPIDIMYVIIKYMIIDYDNLRQSLSYILLINKKIHAFVTEEFINTCREKIYYQILYTDKVSQFDIWGKKIYEHCKLSKFIEHPLFKYFTLTDLNFINIHIYINNYFIMMISSPAGITYWLITARKFIEYDVYHTRTRLTSYENLYQSHKNLVSKLLPLSKYF